MVELQREEERRLWLRWRAAMAVDAPAPDALTLAAYAEFRLSEEEAEVVEDWLAAHPAALAEIAALRTAAGATAEAAPEEMIAAACALILTDDPDAAGKVVPLHPAPAGWRNALAWGSIAASLVATSLVGFAMGSDAYQHLVRTQANEVNAADSFEASSSLETYLSDDSGT